MTLRPDEQRICFSLAIFLVAIASCSTPVHGVQSAQDASTSLTPSSESAAIATLSHNHPQPPSDDDLELLRRLQEYSDNSNVEKRAYSYVSEYKRLPVYNFGLGKRSQSQLYGFGLGKRSRGGKTYSFGLGKRGEEYGDEYVPNDADDDEGENDDEVASDEEDMMEKRNRIYSFGLGKRAKQYSFGLGKRVPGENGRLYSFGLGKRGGPAMYGFGLGKRADGGRLYSFGLGKRPSANNQKSRFDFGLGKRSYDNVNGVDMYEVDDEDLADDMPEEAKRSRSDHRFSFGLGKREISPSELKEVGDESERSLATALENNVGAHSITKRSLHYGFGLGKRSRFDAENDPRVSFANQDEMSRYIRRPYSFGLGKRNPLHDSGIGKIFQR